MTWLKKLTAKTLDEDRQLYSKLRHNAKQRNYLGDHVVLLIHGVRSQGDWQSLVIDILERKDPTIRVLALSYGFFGLISFLLPLFHSIPIKKILRDIKAEADNPNTLRISVIAHSFGTYIFGKIIRQDISLRFYRVLLCGSILPQNFNWDQLLKDKIGDSQDQRHKIINDCGLKDSLPIMAQSIVYGCGASGRFGFKKPGVIDRFHNFGHGDYFKSEFIEKYWLPFFRDGTIQRSIKEVPSTPWIISVLTRPYFQLKVIIPLIFIVCIMYRILRL